MRSLQPSKALTLPEPGPVVPVATNDGKQNNIMTMMLDDGTELRAPLRDHDRRVEPLVDTVALPGVRTLTLPR
jgi:hypothetical protein